MRRNRLLWTLGAVAVLVVVIVAVVLTVEKRPPRVSVAEASREDLSVTVVATGRVEADVRADVVPPTAAKIESIEVAEGQRVKAGQVIAQLDTEQLDAQLRQAEAGERAARAQLRTVRNAGPTSDQIDSADAAVAQAKKSYQQAKSTADSLNATLAKIPELTGVSGTELDASALTNTLVAQSYGQFQQAVAAREALNVDTSGSTEAAQAQVDQAAEQVRLAEQMIDESTLKAPISGVVIFNAVSATGLSGGAAAAAGGGSVDMSSAKPAEGTMVNPQQPPFSVVQLDSLRFAAEVDEADVVRVKAGLSASVRLDAYEGRTFETKVARVLPQSQPTATGGTIFPVRLPLHDTGADLLLGMQGDATILISTVPNAVTIPVEGLQEEGGKKFVFLVADGRLKKRPIETGVVTETRVQVTRGLERGEKVVVSGPDTMRDGMRVTLGD